MTDLTVIIPSWSPARAANLIWELVRRESRKRAHYIVVGCAVPNDLHVNFLPLSTWIPTTDYRLSPVEAMTVGSDHVKAVAGEPDILCFFHDDFLPTDENCGWDRAILDHFASHPRCGLAGFGGGRGFCDPDLYKLPYDYRQLARRNFVSNMRDADHHGRRAPRACRVAALDGFSLIVTREFYDAAGGWAACAGDGIWFHMYDGWISARAAELGYETWMLPVPCHHEGGATSVGMEADYLAVCRRLGYADGQALYDDAHRKFYDRFRGVLPIPIITES